ncbi:MAG: AraC family transcriptional regulator [Sediminibacterium sp.]|nr:AraC family transcriptional regulator [Sediminibacterium sp.]
MYTKIQVLREITPLASADCFTIFSHTRSEFDLPIHYHEEFELNFIKNAQGAKRLVGDHVEEIGEYELVLLGPNLQHTWFTHKCTSKEITEVTIQFHRDLFDEKFLRRNQLSFIRTMLENSMRGVLFSYETASLIAYRILRLNRKDGFESLSELMSILNELSTSTHTRVLSNSTFNRVELAYNSRRIEKVMEYLNEHFHKPISLCEVASLTNMAESAFSRFFRARTGMTFIDSLTEIRLGHASRLLIATTKSVSEIAYETGFNNISNFNRIFKKKKGCTPKEFKKSYSAEERLFF